MGNSSNPRPLYNQSDGVVLDLESANLRSVQINSKPGAITPLSSEMTIRNPASVPYSEILDQLKEKQTKYTDLEFPPESRSIAIDVSSFLPGIEVRWIRPEEIFVGEEDQIQLFKDDIIPNDIRQGLLGDCYFLSALASLAERQSLIQTLFNPGARSKYGCYIVKMFVENELQYILLDDFFPVKKNVSPEKFDSQNNSSSSLLFSKSNGPELWVLLLEKTYAKLHGSYEKIASGKCEEALRDLTGAPTQTVSHLSESELWEFLCASINNRFLLVASSNFETNSQSMVSGHCYSILTTKEVVTDGKNKEKLLKLRNPWGHKEWTGDWSDASPKWTEKLRLELGWEKKDDGIFWMSIGDFCPYFSEITVCEVRDEYHHSSLRLSFNDSKKTCFVGFSLHKKIFAPLTLTISQNKKTHKDLKPNWQKNGKIKETQKWSNENSYFRIIMCKYQNNSLDVISHSSGKVRDLDLRIEKGLDIGDYVILIELEKKETFLESVVLASYANTILTFQEISLNKNEFLDNLFSSLENHGNQNDPNSKIYDKKAQVRRKTVRLNDYVAICYSNKSDFILKEDVYFKETLGFSTLDHQEIPKKLVLHVPPHSKLIFKLLATLIERDLFASLKFQSFSTLCWSDSLEKMAEYSLENPFKILQRKMNGELINIFINVFYSVDTLGLLFRNDTEKTYKEVVTFKLKNLKPKNFDANGLIITLKPADRHFLVFVVEKSEEEVWYKMNYVPLLY